MHPSPPENRQPPRPRRRSGPAPEPTLVATWTTKLEQLEGVVSTVQSRLQQLQQEQTKLQSENQALSRCAALPGRRPVLLPPPQARQPPPCPTTSPPRSTAAPLLRHPRGAP